MQLLASHFPYEMSVDKDGLWSFWNRRGRPAGVCLAEDDERWDAHWESYPPCRIKLHGLDEVTVRRLCCEEWLATNGGPVEEESLRLYGTDSTPGVSADNMSAHLDRLRVLIEAGALAKLFPYGMALRDVDTWVFFNRGTGPVGVSPAVAVGWGHPKAEWPVRVRLAGLDGGTLECLGHAVRWGPEGDPGAGGALLRRGVGADEVGAAHGRVPGEALRADGAGRRPGSGLRPDTADGGAADVGTGWRKRKSGSTGECCVGPWKRGSGR